MKVLLVNPPGGHTLRSNLPERVEEQRGINPPIGLLYVAAQARLEKSRSVKILDAFAEGLDEEGLNEAIRRERPDVVGISAVTFTLLDALTAARAAKRSSPVPKVVLGGLHPHLYPEETISQPNVDCLVLGEGESSFDALLTAFDREGPLDDVSGLVFRRNGDSIRTPLPPLIEDLDALPLPARDLVPTERYTSLVSRQGPTTIMVSSRGCPFQCQFCTRSITGKTFRPRSAPAVVEEIESCLALGVREILMYDEVFTIRRDRVFEICREILGRRLTFRWMVRATVETVDPEMLRMLSRAGCSLITYGIEAGNDRVRRSLGKKFSLEKAKEAFRATRAAGIESLAYFMIGNPGEGPLEVEETLRASRRLRPDLAHFALFVPYPATSVYEEALSSGEIDSDYWRAFAVNPSPTFQPPFWTGRMSEAELDRMIASVYRRFYLRPGYMVRQLFKIRTGGELIRKLRSMIILFIPNLYRRRK